MSSEVYKQDLNNNRIRTVQRGDALKRREGLEVEFFGHSSFRLTTPQGIKVLFDPWRNDPEGNWGLWYHREFPAIETDVLITTHPHFDHDAIYRPDASMILDRLVGEFELGDLCIRGIADKHVTEAPGKHDWTRVLEEFDMALPPDNPVTFDNVMYVVELGGFRVLKWADNRHDPPDYVWEMLTDKPIDLLFLPVDGTSHILSYEQAETIIERIDPRIVVPEHYLVDGVTSTLAVLEDAEEWVAQQDNVRRLETGSFQIGREELDSYDSSHVYYFGHNHALPAEASAE